MGAPLFLQSKAKTNPVQFMSDFCHINRQLKRKRFPMPKICDMLLILEGFEYAISLDLYIGYYHISVSEEASNLCMIILSCGKYQYKHLPIGVRNIPEICRRKRAKCYMNINLSAYTDNLLLINKTD